MYKHIVLAADGSENSVRAAQHALLMARQGAELIEVVVVADFAKAKQDVLHAESRESLDYERRQKVRVIEELLQREKIVYEVKVLHGDPGPTLVDYANSQNVDLVIIGSRGLNSLQEMVLGSVSHKVVKRVKAPVLVVK
ncbi:nucleotide-binding universal stress UspA family protein [Chryseomicrobium aureum]|uniref:universal stress protein n=1 Tax=Chryseomicrobium aureum TaxID=1441723 RepID=UPI00195DB6F0|nr:universal stress protein [Chryseomicrobium aureum]MBM7706329.1 nucleotide-binding universal stress UspA family protein [Chryseomicrobium aureum]